LKALEVNTHQLLQKSFSQEDQRLFAALSADHNPMHMSATLARRLITGRQVVHGMHILLTAIEHWKNDHNIKPASLACTFANPISVGEAVVFSQACDEESGTIIIEASVHNLPCARIEISTMAPDAARNPASPPNPIPPVEVSDQLTLRTKPLDELPESHVGKLYAIKASTADIFPLFPRACHLLGHECVGAIATLSYFVGMICPGMHSVFSSLNLETCPTLPPENPLVFSVNKYDPRFRLFDIRFTGPIRGNIKAFLRAPPLQQPTMLDLAKHVTSGEFRGTRALIIGGSRGLGELTAKILATGGAAVALTYATGHEDAIRILGEITTTGHNSCEIYKLDFLTDAFDSSSIPFDTFDTVYFFATPRIYRKKSGVFDLNAFQEFFEFYIKRFHELCIQLERRNTRKVKVFFPSSVFVSQRPRGMTEYAMVKAAAEVLIEDINNVFSNVNVASVRLPKLNTDQTNSIAGIAGAANVDALLPVIRAMHE
jgi:NAD(P)-dependent dehydrogenase (short-subunit alcohol dehydrogenase family)